MNRRYGLIGGAVLIALLLIGVVMAGAQPSLDAPGVLGWQQVNLDGFGTRENWAI
jgi:hypothetical protein